MGKCRGELAIPLIAPQDKTEYQLPYFLFTPHLAPKHEASNGFGFLQELLTIFSDIDNFDRSAFVVINHMASLAKAFSIGTKEE